MTRALRVLHVASGDLWAGAEAQAFTLMACLTRMPGTDVAAVVVNEGVLAEKLRSVGVLLCVLDETKTTSLKILLQLSAVVRNWKPDIVHTHREKENILGSLASRISGNVPSVRSVHGAREHSTTVGARMVRNCMVTGLNRWCGRVLQQRIIAVTRELGVQLAREFRREKVTVVENGVDSAAVRRDMRVAEFRAAAPTATHVGIAGRLVVVKRVDIFLQAAALLVRQCPDRRWKFHIFGDGPMRCNLMELSASLQLGDSVIFHGHRQDIATCLGGLDVLVICSDHEGLPMISLEAAALELPTVAHAVGGLVEVVPEEFLVTRHEAAGYQDGILRALRTDGRAISAKRASETLTLFSAQRNAERMRALYEEVVAERNDETTEG
jgi:L-malate glycosyltransferase